MPSFTAARYYILVNHSDAYLILAMCESHDCLESEFSCPVGPDGCCLESYYICDGYSDCMDHTDEENCESTTTGNVYLTHFGGGVLGEVG